MRELSCAAGPESCKLSGQQIMRFCFPVYGSGQGTRLVLGGRKKSDEMTDLVAWNTVDSALNNLSTLRTIALCFF